MPKRICYVDATERWEGKYTFLENLGFLLYETRFIDKRVINLEGEKLNVLDYGCSFGYLLILLKSLGHNVYGVDSSEYACNKLRPSIEAGHIFNQSCGEKIPLDDGFFDLITTFDMIEHLDNKNDNEEFRKMITESHRLLKKDGRMLIATPNYSTMAKIVHKIVGKGWIYSSEIHRKLMKKKEIKNMVGSHFSVEHIHYDTWSAKPLRRLVDDYFSSKFHLSTHIVFVLKKETR